jgi:peroxin-2
MSFPGVDKAMRRAETVWRCASVLNLVLFLWRGAFPHLVERLLGLRMRAIAPRASRSVAFDFMNRQLVWQGLTEFLLFFAPLVSFAKVQKLFRRNVPGLLLAANECGLCGARPLENPHGAAGCRHASCYFCIAQKLEEDGEYPCPKCGASVTRDSLVRLAI